MKLNKKKKLEEIKAKEQSYHTQIQMVRVKNDYIKNLLNARYYAARVNMIVDQLNSNKIKEMIDGCIKTKELMVHELTLMRLQAINSYRNAHFMKVELMKDYNMTEDGITAFEMLYYEGKLDKETWDESDFRRTKAEFVNS
jgi:hypothetical protein